MMTDPDKPGDRKVYYDFRNNPDRFEPDQPAANVFTIDGPREGILETEVEEH
jgi:hypothetical protein